MPVLLDRRTLDGSRPAKERRASNVTAFPGQGTHCIEIGLINNMPDSALESTERQFRDLLQAAAGDLPVRLRLFSIPDVPRGELGLRHLSRGYSYIGKLWDSRLDGLIVTGTEPRAPRLNDEPYWGSLTRVLDWAEDHTISTVWSCLAAHAAVLYADGIARNPLAEKRFGVFDCARVSEHALLAGAASRLRIPHSRWNELREDPLTLAGYTILTRSSEAGVDMFVRQRRSLFVFFQGHPEYDERALLREYRRDVGSFLRRERETYPVAPQKYFDDAAATAVDAFHARAVAERHEALLETFPTGLLERCIRPMRRAATARVYSNWLSYLSTQKKQRQASTSHAASVRPGRANLPYSTEGVS